MRRPEKRGYRAGVSTMEPTRVITEARAPPASAPRSVHRPVDGLMRPNRQRIVVVLPAPFGPRNPNTPPWGTAMSSPSTASVRPPRTLRYSLRRASTSITAVFM